MRNSNSVPKNVVIQIDNALKALDNISLPEKAKLKSTLKKIISAQVVPACKNEALFRTTLYSIGDAVITTDTKGKIQNMNHVAENLCEWKERDAKNKSLETVFKVVNEYTKRKVENSVSKVLKSGKILSLENNSLLITKKGKEIPIADSSAPIKNDSGEIVGVVLVFRDQRNERDYKKALEERERKFSTLVSNLPGFIYRCANNHNWTMQFISDGCYDTTGYKPSDFINDKKLSFNEIIHPDYKKQIWEEWKKILKDRKYFEFEYPIITKNKTIKWVWERGRGVYSDKGKLLFLEGYITDISKIKEIENRITESEARYKSLFDGSPDAIFLANPDTGIIIDVNKAALNLTGFNYDEIVGIHHTKLHPQRKEEISKKGFIAHSKMEQSAPIENFLLCKDGKEIPIEVLASVIEVNGNKILQGVFRDITQRKQTEEKLRNSEISFRNIFNSVSEAIYIQNKEGIFVDVNDGASAMYGYSRKELVGQSPAFVSAPGKNDIPKVAAMVLKAFNGEKQQFEFWGKRKNGEIFLKDVRLYPGKFFNENVIIAVARDITKEKEAEIALRLSEERYKLIAENTIDSIAIFDFNLNYTYLSPSVKKLLGYSPEELTKIGVKKILTPDSLQKIQKIYEEEITLEAIGTNDINRSRIVETQQIRKDGEVIWAESTLSFIRDKENVAVNILAVSRDITARKLVEQALADSEERYRIISNLTSDYLFSTFVDEAGNNQLVWVAGSFEKITGYTMDEYVAAGGWLSRLHPDDVETDLKDMDNLKSNHKVISEVRTLHKSGNIIWVRTYAHPVWDNKNNKLKGIYGAVEDITQRKQTEMLQKIQYNIADAVVTSKSISDLFVVVRNELSKTINVNNFFIALYDEKTGLLKSDVDKDEIEEISEWQAKGSMTGYVIETGKTQLLSKAAINQLIENGIAGMIGVIPEVWLGVPFKVSGKVIGVLVVQSYNNPDAFNTTSVEILEIVAHELSIFIQHKNSEEETLKLSTAIIQSPASIVITDLKGNIEYVNPKFTSISGYTLEEIKGKNPRFLKSGEHNIEFYKNLWVTILSGKDWQGEIKNKKKNGELYWENVIISPITNNQNTVTHFVAVKEDITDKKKMIEELILAKEKAEEMNRVKSSFFANMSHELRTPMVGILGFSEVLMQDLEDNPEHLHMIKSINTSGRRLLETLNMILNLSKLEAAKVETNLQTINIVELLQESFNNFSSAANKKGLNYRFIHDTDTILCDVDTILFQSIFNNLLNNAIKFTDDGNIRMILKIIDNNVCIEVEDSGVGISADKLHLIWDEFRQASEGYSRSFEGTGLGLTIAKRHTELLNGKISVKSLAGIGTTFTVTLPLSLSQLKNQNTFSDVTSVSTIENTETSDKPRILYVEDDEVSVLYVKTVTKDLFHIDSANNADEAISSIKRTKYDGILMDINLRKGIDGLELTKIIRKNPEYKNTPIIALTAFAMGHEKQEFLNKGMTHYLSKPFVKQQLLDVLKSAIDK